MALTEKGDRPDVPCAHQSDAKADGAGTLVGPAAIEVLGQFEIALRFFGQESGYHAHGELDGNFARAALFELLAEPAINFFVASL
jgi:hypothetical protein